jgi:hypothetical protein
MTKRCPKCGIEKARTEFNKDSRTKDGLRGWCRDCTRADSRERYKRNPPTPEQQEAARKLAREWRRENRKRHAASKHAFYQRHPEKKRAKDAVYFAVRRGDLVRTPCEVCGSANVWAFHDDYFKPLDVRWLCPKHHMEAVTARRSGHQITPSVEPRRLGYEADAQLRKVIEDHAMEQATLAYQEFGFDVQDVSGNQPFDLLCTHPDGSEIHVEVKGTRGKGEAIQLTRNEVEHARGHKGRVALFVLHSVTVSDDPQGPVATGGQAEWTEDWDIEAGRLKPTAFQWSPPPAAASRSLVGVMADGDRPEQGQRL